MKAVLMSIKPKWCELIFSGEKTVEVRKVAPKLETPYKVYAYQTKNRGGSKIINDCLNSVYGGGKVVGEWVCDKTIELPCETTQPHWLKEKTCLSDDEYIDYLGHKDGKGLYIAKPKRYDTPKALSEFYRRLPDKVLEEGNYDCRKDWNMVCIDYPEMSDLCDDCIFGGRVQLARPPQSWCYVEEIEE